MSQRSLTGTQLFHQPALSPESTMSLNPKPMLNNTIVTTKKHAGEALAAMTVPNKI